MKNDNYVAVLNHINVIDEMLQDHNNGDTEIIWYDGVYISSVQMKYGFIVEGVSSADIFHKEYLDCSIEIASVDEETIQISNVLIKYIDTTRFYDDPRAQMDGGAK